MVVVFSVVITHVPSPSSLITFISFLDMFWTSTIDQRGCRANEARDTILGLKGEKGTYTSRKAGDVPISESSRYHGRGKSAATSPDGGSTRRNSHPESRRKQPPSHHNSLESKKPRSEVGKSEKRSSVPNDIKADETLMAKPNKLAKSSIPKDGPEALALLQEWNRAGLFVSCFTDFSIGASALVDSVKSWFANLWAKYHQAPSFPSDAIIEGRNAPFFIMSYWHELAATMAGIIQTNDPSANLLNNWKNGLKSLEKYCFDVSVHRLALNHLVSEHVNIVEASLKSLEGLTPPEKDIARVEETLEDLDAKIGDLHDQLKEFESEKILA